MNMGKKIKSLRLSSSMTQEQLASRLGISAQAVSKWESGTNMPDIQILPDLSVIFGVTIDELFDMSDDHRLDRIENMLNLDNVRFIPEEEFHRGEEYLKQCRAKTDLNPRATLLLAMLYNKRADEYHDMAKPLAREALEKNPGNKDAFVAVFDAENGPYQDWNMTNHASTIAFYLEETAKHPEDIRYYFWLLDLLIADHRTEEAREYVERMRAVEHSYHYEMYMGYICQAEGDLNAAMDWWEKMRIEYPGKWQVVFEYGSILAKLGRYDEAMTYFRQAAPMRSKPRFTDCEHAIAQICQIQGDIPGAIEANHQMLRVVQEDWVTEGESVDWILREIERLEALL